MYWNPNIKNNTTVGGGGGNFGFGLGIGLGFNTSSSSNPAPPPPSDLHSISFQSSTGVNDGGGMSTNSCGTTNRNKAPAVSSTSSLLLDPDVELAVEWSHEEQSILDDGLSKYADGPNIFKYIKISATLPDKTVRDVALRCRWMTKKGNGKRRKPEEYYTGKKMKDRKEKPEPSSKSSPSLSPPLNMGAYSLMMQRRDQNERISCEVSGIGATTKHLLDENTLVFSHITANLATYKIQENVDLFGRTRSNILAIINDMREMPGIMSQMPPLPVSINEELANIVLPQMMTYCSPTGIHRKPEWRC